MPVTISDVRNITGSSLDDSVITALIADAELIGGPCINGYDQGRQDSIVKWLAAHLVASTTTGGTSGALTSDSLGDASQSYERGTVGEGLKGTLYGQQALALDLNGCLTRRGNPPATVAII